MIVRVFFMAIALSLPGALVFAQGQAAGGDVAETQAPQEAGRQGWNVAFPAYLFGDASVSGVQAGFQLKNLQFRLDALLASGVRNGDVFLYALPALGFYYSEEWDARIRTYQGISAGAEIGIINSFGGVNAYANLLTGIEWYVFRNKAFFFEVGTGIGYPAIEGAFNGGTVLGGGAKLYF